MSGIALGVYGVGFTRGSIAGVGRDIIQSSLAKPDSTRIPLM